MQTVNFNCPHCGNLMAVGVNLLGRNVRCPHCKQVVQSPGAAGAAPGAPPPPPPAYIPPPPPPANVAPPPTVPLPQFNLPKSTEAPESIFGELQDDDLFGTAPAKPNIPAPPPQYRPAPAPVDYPAPSPGYAPPGTPNYAVPPAAPNNLDPTTYLPPPSAPHPQVAPQPATAPTVDIQPSYSGSATLDFVPPPTSPEFDRGSRRPEPDSDGRSERDRDRDRETDRNATKSSYRDRRDSKPPSRGPGILTWILLLYSVVSTVVAAILGYSALNPEKEHPFKAIPDVFGEYEKANRKTTSFRWMPPANLPLPADLRVRLGESLAVGQLMIRPIQIERKLLKVTTEYARGESKEREIPPVTLVMRLELENTSEDVTFHPVDPALLRHPNVAVASHQPPYAYLSVGKERFFGMFEWPFPKDIVRHFVEEFEDSPAPLKPGEKRVFSIAIAPKEAVDKAIARQTTETQFLWRLHLRRGVVAFKDSSGREGEFSATCVVGVDFDRKEIGAPPKAQ